MTNRAITAIRVWRFSRAATAADLLRAEREDFEWATGPMIMLRRGKLN